VSNKPTEIKYVTPEQALQVKEEKDFLVKSLGAYIRVRKLTFNDLGIIYSKAKDDPFAMAKWMIFGGVVKPRWSTQQIEQMRPEVATEISTIVADYSGMTPEAIRRTRNLSEMTEATVSGH